MNANLWTADEEQVLRALWPANATSVIAGELGRSTQGVQRKIFRLGLAGARLVGAKESYRRKQAAKHEQIAARGGHRDILRGRVVRGGNCDSEAAVTVLRLREVIAVLLGRAA